MTPLKLEALAEGDSRSRRGAGEGTPPPLSPPFGIKGASEGCLLHSKEGCDVVGVAAWACLTEVPARPPATATLSPLHSKE